MSPKTLTLGGGDAALMVMTSDLLEARLAVLGGASPATAAAEHVPHAVRDGRIQVIIGVREITDDVLAAIGAAGLEVVNTYNQGDLHTVTVRCTSPLQLDAIAALPQTRVILSEPPCRTSSGVVTSQGDTSHRASNARASFGVNGTGHRVGVLSDSFIDLRLGAGVIGGGFLTGSTDQISGDLPASIRVIDPGPGGGSDEGNGMAQLIYDLAPGCDISFASAFSGYFAFAGNITALHTDAAAPADVLVDDVYYYGEPMYQDGPIAVAASNAAAAGVPYFSSAGNFGNQGHERNYLDVNGPLDDMPPAPNYFPTGNDLHDFGVASGMASDAYLTITMTTGGQIDALLYWDEPYGGGLAPGPGSAADLDLWLIAGPPVPPNAGNTVSVSNTKQALGGVPSGDSYEYLIDTVAPGTYQLCIEHYRGRDDTSPIPLTLSFIVAIPQGTGVINDVAYLGDRTMFGHPTAQDVQAVAAMFYREEELNGGFTAPPAPQLDVESFSSLGGALPFWFPWDGSTRYGAPVTRNKPDLTGIDGTDTTFFGSSDFEPNGFLNFWGTSAAAPHVAAVAALLLEADPSLTPAQVYNQLRSTARDAETAGPDFLSGDGLVDAFAAVQPLGILDWADY